MRSKRNLTKENRDRDIPRKEKDLMENTENRHIIWHNDACLMFDDVKQDLKEDPEQKSLTEEEIWNEVYDLINIELDDMTQILDITTEHKIILVGIMERWDGAKAAYKETDFNNIGQALRAATSYFNGDNTFEIYVEEDSLKISQTGHDNPVNPSVFEFRELTTDPEELEDNTVKTLLAHSKPLGDRVTEIYGWEQHKDTNNNTDMTKEERS